MLNYRTRKNVSLVLFIGLMLTTALFWSMNGVTDGGLRDGTYTTTGQGFNGDIVVELSVASGSIAQVEVTSHEDTPAIAGPAIESLTAAIVQAQAGQVDMVSGATFTSTGLLEAVEKALTLAGTTFTDGVYVGRAEGFNADVVVEVTVESGTITQVEVTEHDDTPFVAQNAIDTVPASIVEAQSVEVDAVSGATLTSTGIINAVRDALDLE